MGIERLPQQTPRLRILKMASLQSGVPQSCHSHLIRLQEADARVLQLVLFTKLLHQRNYSPKMAPWQARKQVVLHLKLQSAMKPIHPRRTGNVKGPHRLFLEPVVPLRLANVNVGREVAETELNVLKTCDDKAGGN